MTMQLSVATRNAMLDAIETAIGPSPKLRLRSGAAPANVAAASSGTVIAEMDLPADFMAAAAAGAKSMSGTWQDASANATGAVGHFEIVSSDGATRHMQGTVTATGGGGDMTLDNVNVNAGQSVSITSFTLTAPNA
jgi:hypothetical protein